MTNFLRVRLILTEMLLLLEALKMYWSGSALLPLLSLLLSDSRPPRSS